MRSSPLPGPGKSADNTAAAPANHALPPSTPSPVTLSLALAALGVIYGDIGASPLYAIKECFHGMHAMDLSEANILGVLSLIFWSLTMVVSVKYVTFIMTANNKGEGGIFALLALLGSSVQPHKKRMIFLSLCAPFSAPHSFTATASSPRPSQCFPPSRD